MAANTAVSRLVELDLLEEITGKTRHRVFASQRVISIFLS